MGLLPIAVVDLALTVEMPLQVRGSRLVRVFRSGDSRDHRPRPSKALPSHEPGVEEARVRRDEKLKGRIWEIAHGRRYRLQPLDEPLLQDSSNVNPLTVRGWPMWRVDTEPPSWIELDRGHGRPSCCVVIPSQKWTSQGAGAAYFVIPVEPVFSVEEHLIPTVTVEVNGSN